MAANLKLCSISEPPDNDEQGETTFQDHDDMDQTCLDDSQLAQQQQDTTALPQKTKQRIRRTFTTYQWLTLMGGSGAKAIRDHQ